MEDDPQRRFDFEKYVKAMGNNFPNLLRILSTNEKRHFFKLEGLRKPYGSAYASLPMVGVADQLANTSIESVLKKIFRALHFKHSDEILPIDGEITVRWMINAYLHSRGDEFAKLAAVLSQRPEIKRGRRDLSDQFSYYYGIEPNSKVTAYLLSFRNSLLAMGIVSAIRGALTLE